MMAGINATLLLLESCIIDLSNRNYFVSCREKGTTFYFQKQQCAHTWWIIKFGVREGKSIREQKLPFQRYFHSILAMWYVGDELRDAVGHFIFLIRVLPSRTRQPHFRFQRAILPNTLTLVGACRQLCLHLTLVYLSVLCCASIQLPLQQ